LTSSAVSAILARCEAAARDPVAAARDVSRRPDGGPILGYVCSYVPEEIILAAGLHPLRLGARPEPAGLADGCLQSFACSFARGLLDGLLADRGRGLAGVVFAHTCDSLRAVLEAWRNRRPEGSFVHFVNLPALVEGPGVVEYAAAEFGRLADALPDLPGARPVTAQALAAAIDLADSLRYEIGRLDALRAGNSGLLRGTQFLTIARGLTVIDRREALDLVRAAADELTARAGGSSAQAVRHTPAAGSAGRARARLFVSGGFLETEEPLRLVEEAGADVIGDDLCLGGRTLSFAPARTLRKALDLRDLLAGLARSHLSRLPCPTKHPPLRRLEYILSEAASRQADGIVFLLQKFCDPHAFDYPYFREALEAAGRPCLLLEVEQGGLAAGQARTRIEAFLERLGPVAEPGGSGGGRK
jgi:benzoyl-CoA reductase subunit C